MMPSIVPVVEGPGETSAVPILLRRMLQEECGRYDINVGRPKTAKNKGNLVKRLESFVTYAASEPECAAILVLVDSDDDCPVESADDLANRCRAIFTNRPIAIVFAVREYEAWFIASIDTIRQSEELAIVDAPSSEGGAEEIGSPKGWLARQYPVGRTYKPTSDQASLTTMIDFQQARNNSRSFRRLCNAVQELVTAIDSGLPMVSPA